MLSYFISFSEDDILMRNFDTMLYSTENLETDNFTKFYNKDFNFRSCYFLIIGMKILLRIFFLPLVIYLLLKSKKAKENLMSEDQDLDNIPIPNPTKKQSLLFRITIKVLLSIYVMTQFEGLTYFCTSMRITPTALDSIFMVINLSFLISFQFYMVKVAQRTTPETKEHFKALESQFIHLSSKGRALERDTLRFNYPVIVIQNSIFTIKCLVLIVTSFFNHVNVYMFCLTSIVLACF